MGDFALVITIATLLTRFANPLDPRSVFKPHLPKFSASSHFQHMPPFQSQCTNSFSVTDPGVCFNYQEVYYGLMLRHGGQLQAAFLARLSLCIIIHVDRVFGIQILRGQCGHVHELYNTNRAWIESSDLRCLFCQVL
jgi:hypothetical protein